MHDSFIELMVCIGYSGHSGGFFARSWESKVDLGSFYNWWKAKCPAGEVVPSMRTFIPAELGFDADWVHCVRRMDYDHARIAFWGVGLDSLASRPLLGQNYFELLEEDDAAAMGEHMDHVMSLPCGGYVERTVLTFDGRELHFRSLDLPLRGQDGRITHMCGINELVDERVPTRARLLERAGLKLSNFRYFDLGTGPVSEAWHAA